MDESKTQFASKNFLCNHTYDNKWNTLSSDNSYNAGITTLYYNGTLDTKIAVISGYIYTQSNSS